TDDGGFAIHCLRPLGDGSKVLSTYISVATHFDDGVPLFRLPLNPRLNSYLPLRQSFPMSMFWILGIKWIVGVLLAVSNRHIHRVDGMVHLRRIGPLATHRSDVWIVCDLNG
ncbi:MAG: hypothetical protein JWM11_5030, partial [Planctomycetaceae bacterium]|nr:hypothetical protein [Planctomycetaceae bacterium]